VYYYWHLFAFPKWMSLHRSKDRLKIGLHRATSFRISLLTVRVWITSNDDFVPAENSASRCILIKMVQFLLSCALCPIIET
jgi:hypothetical protein